jgi:acetyl-CoA C-acetyltransferase
MLYEMYNQLLERVPEERKVKDARLGLTHNMGGIPSQNCCSVAIVGRE